MYGYRISNSMYKRITERKNRLILLLFICAMAQIVLIAVCVMSGRDGIILGCVLEPILLFLVWKYLRHDIKALGYKNTSGTITAKIVDRSINRTGAVYGQAYSGWKGKVKYLLIITSDEREYTVEVPGKDAFLSYAEGDLVQMLPFMPYPIVTNRTPKPAVCPQCGRIIHYEDGACHECGLEDIYPEIGRTPKPNQQ